MQEYRPGSIAQGLATLGLRGEIHVRVCTAIAEVVIRETGIVAGAPDELVGVVTDVDDLTVEWSHDPLLPLGFLSYEEEGQRTLLNVIDVLPH